MENFDKKLVYMDFLQHEGKIVHHTYSDELKRYNNVRDGITDDFNEKNLKNSGKLSDDPIRNEKYLFVASTTLASRFAITGGMEEMEAYNLSDLYIQKMDKLQTVESIRALQADMIKTYTKKMAELHKMQQRSVSNMPPLIKKACDYIYYHLHEKITTKSIAENIHISPSYFSAYFKKNMGKTVKSYITEKRIEAAKNMLAHSDYSLTDIGTYLAFSSTSHFINTFKSITGLTPKKFREKYQNVSL